MQSDLRCQLGITKTRCKNEPLALPTLAVARNDVEQAVGGIVSNLRDIDAGYHLGALVAQTRM